MKTRIIRLICTMYLMGNLVLHAQTLLRSSFIGPITQDTVYYNIRLPEGYDTATTTFPVVYHLHGLGGNQGGPQNFQVPAAFTDALDEGLIDQKYIVVFPNGKSNSMWADSKLTDKRIETNVIHELIPHIDLTYKVSGEKSDRYIQGFSMGGYGTALYLYKYPGLFQSGISFDGALHTWETLKENRPEIITEMFADDSIYFQQYSPYYWAKMNGAAQNDSVCFRQIVGDLTAYNERFRDSLIQNGVIFQYQTTICGHDLSCILGQEGAASVLFYSDCIPSTAIQWVGEGNSIYWSDNQNWWTNWIPNGAFDVYLPNTTIAQIQTDTAAGCRSLHIDQGAQVDVLGTLFVTGNE